MPTLPQYIQREYKDRLFKAIFDRDTEESKKEDKSGDFEWSADVININPKCNKPLQKSCKALYDYIRYIYWIKDNRKSGMDKKEAVEEIAEKIGVNS
ncbi:MAG: hypothetical protein J6S91_04535 [Treponema sp.]|nr:hypothetical protein [Treponema sp.]